MASVLKVKLSRKDMKRMNINVSAPKVGVPLRVLIPMKVGFALIRLGALIAGITYKQD